MDPLSLAVTIILISVSGAMAPGPLFFVTVSQGIKSGTKSGLIFSIAHSLIEFTLILLLALGLLTVANESTVRLAVGVAGGLALMVFGVLQMRGSLKQVTQETVVERTATKNLFLMGLALTGLNPYFIIWWLTIGANLIFLSLEFAGLAGVIFMYLCHVWIDYAWLTLVATLAKSSTKILRQRWYRALMAVFGAVLIYFGASFIVDSVAF